VANAVANPHGVFFLLELARETLIQRVSSRAVAFREEGIGCDFLGIEFLAAW
jgi:hypothetical protein